MLTAVWNPAWATAIVCVLLCSPAGAAEAGQPPQPRYGLFGPEVQGFKLEINTGGSAFASGQPLLLSVVLHNVSSNDALIRASRLDYAVQITGPDGKQVSMTTADLSF